MRFSHLLLLPIVFFAGCAGPGSSREYADKLKLPVLEAPAKLAPLENVTSQDLGPIYEAIEKAQTVSQADLAVSQTRQGNALISSLMGSAQASGTDTPEIKAKRRDLLNEFNAMTASLEQAGQIKRAQLEDGDAKDATGEVAERLLFVRQGVANINQIAKEIPPATTFGQPAGTSGGSVPDVAPAGGGIGTGLGPEERVWVRNCHEAFNRITRLDSSLSNAETFAKDRTESEQAKGQYERMLVPPRFAKADSLLRPALAKYSEAVALFAQEIESGGRAGLRERSLNLFDEYDDLKAKGFAEVKAAGGD